jgi:stromal membrane-associated protein
MENGGNQKVNLIFEAHLNVAKPTNTATGPIRERFIRDKYERRKFYDPNAFALASEMESNNNNSGHGSSASEGDKQKVIAGVQRRLAAERPAVATAVRKPSDAARKRVEERAARNRSMGGNGVAVNSNSVRSKPIKTPAVAAAPAPVVDLLDFGDFDSPEATAAVAPPVPVAVASASTTSNNEPVLDLFANMSVSNDVPQQQQQQQQSRHAQGTEQKKMTNDDILSMFHSPTPQQNVMQQNMFGIGGGMPNGMGGANMMMNQNNMGMMNNFGGNNGNMMNHGQMTGQPNAMGGGGMNQQQMFQMQMMQQQQQQQMMGIQNNFGGMMNGNTMQGGQMNNMQGGNQFGQSPMGQSQLQQQSPQKQQQGGAHFDQFADFGNFGR